LTGLCEAPGQVTLEERGEASTGKSVYHGNVSGTGEEGHFCLHPFTAGALPWFLFWPHGRRKSLK
jgi:hypothetical protein